MQQIISADRLRLRIGKKGEAVSVSLAKRARLFRSIDTNGYGPDTRLFELGQPSLDTSQLEVAKRSPISPIEDQQHRFRTRRALKRFREQLRKLDRCSAGIDQAELRCRVSDPWRFRRSRQIPGMVESGDPQAERHKRNDTKYRARNFAAINLRPAERACHSQNRQR